MRTNTLIPVFIVAALSGSLFAVGLIATARVVGPFPLSVSQTLTQKQSTFDVQGESEITVVPDNAQITLGIEARNRSISDAQTQANTVMNTIRGELEALGIAKEDIKTENYSVYPEYDYTNSERRVLGYNVNSSLRVSIKDFEKLNEVIDKATTAGANQVGGVQFTISPDKEKELTKQLREEAIDVAKENAQELSSLAGMRLGKIVNIAELPQGRNDSVFLPMVADKAMGGAESEPTQLEPGSTAYKYSVTLSYETL